VGSIDDGRRRTGLPAVFHQRSRRCAATDHASRPGSRVPAPRCYLPSGIGYGIFRAVTEDPVTRTIVFDTTLDALKLRADSIGGDQIFAVRPDGSGLRQLTDAPGAVPQPDGSIRVELPGPFAYSAALH
jgi:hypothetical protein